MQLITPVIRRTHDSDEPLSEEGEHDYVEEFIEYDSQSDEWKDDHQRISLNPFEMKPTSIFPSLLKTGLGLRLRFINISSGKQ